MPTYAASPFFTRADYAGPLLLAVLSLGGSAVTLCAFRSCDALQRRLLRPVIFFSAMLLLWALCGVTFFTPAVMGWRSLNELSPFVCGVLGGVGNFALFGAIGMYVCVTYNLLLAFVLPVQAATCWGSCYPGCCGPATEPDRVIISAGQWEPPIVLGIDLALSLVLGLSGCFGTAGNGDKYECWIKDTAPAFWRMIAIYFPLIFAMLFSLITAMWVWFVGSRRLMPHQWKQTRRRLAIFVVVFVCFGLPPMITRSWEFAFGLSLADTEPPPPLKVLHTTIINGAGFLFFLVWAPTKLFRPYWRRMPICVGLAWLVRDGDLDPLNSDGARTDDTRSGDYENFDDAVARLQQAGYVAYRVPDELGRSADRSALGFGAPTNMGLGDELGSSVRLSDASSISLSSSGAAEGCNSCSASGNVFFVAPGTQGHVPTPVSSLLTLFAWSEETDRGLHGSP